MAIAEYAANTQSVSTTEWSMVNDSSSIATETNARLIQPVVDLSGITKMNDVFDMRCYEKVKSGGTQRAAGLWSFQGLQNGDFAGPGLLLMHGWDFTLKKYAGADRTLTWSLRSLAPTCAETYQNDGSIGTSEYSIPAASTSLSAITTDGIYQLWLDLSAMAAGDHFEVKFYEKAQSSDTKRLICPPLRFRDVQAVPHVAFPMGILINGWDMTLQKIAGTDRTIPASIRQVT